MSAPRWLVACALLALGLLFLTGERVAERGRFARAYSSLGSGPEGARGLFLLTRELGFETLRWSQDLARLPPRSSLLALGGCSHGLARPLSRYERQELLRWVRAGGLLIVAGARDYLPEGFGIGFEAEPGCVQLPSEEAEALEPTPPLVPEVKPRDATRPPDAGAVLDRPDAGAVERASSAAVDLDASVTGDEAPLDEEASGARSWGLPMARAVSGLPIVPFHEAGKIVLGPDVETDAETLLAVPPDERASELAALEPLLVVVPHGQGRVIVLAAANMLQNGELASSDGGTLFARLLRTYAPPGPVLFDEYHLGMGERRSLMQYLRQLGAMPLVFQLALLIACALWRAGARFGAARLPVERPARGTASFVTALGRLYQNAGDGKAAVRLIARAALTRIASHHGLPLAPASALEQTLAQRGALAARDAVRNIVAAVSGSDESAQLPQVVQRIDAALAGALANPVAVAARTGVPQAARGTDRE